MSRFYDAGALGRTAINLFHGYGYNFYRDENQLRADDQKVRSLVCEILGMARKAVVAAEGAYRRENIPPPSRANPFPDPDAVAQAKRLEALSEAVGRLEGQVRHAPVPENDRMTQRFRNEAETLAALIERDKLLVGQADAIRQLATGAPEAILDARAEIEEGIGAIADSLAARRVMTI